MKFAHKLTLALLVVLAVVPVSYTHLRHKVCTVCRGVAKNKSL